jgi:putative effector of murein hydrolase LrgA (UPF0299 family)
MTVNREALMLGYLTIILVCQLIGELFVTALALPVPGPVAGMAILFAGLVARGGIPDELGDVADVLLKNLSLLFIPAGVGVMLHVQLLQREWLSLTAALILSTLLTIGVTAAIMAWLRPGGPEKGE